MGRNSLRKKLFMETTKNGPVIVIEFLVDTID